MSQLAAMGVAVPDEATGEMAIPGDWQVVSQNPLQSNEAITDEPKLSLGVRKRKIESDEAEGLIEAGTARGRGWGSIVKTIPSDSKSELDILLSKDIDLQKTALLAQQSITESPDDKPRPDQQPDPESHDCDLAVHTKREKDEPDMQGLMDKIPAHDENTKDSVAEDQQILFKKRKSKKVPRRGDT